jgi:hypothetical protein
MYRPWFKRKHNCFTNPATGYKIMHVGTRADVKLYDIWDKDGWQVLPESNPLNLGGGLKSIANRDYIKNVQKR